MQRFHTLKFPSSNSMEKAAHTACKLFKSLSLCQFGLLSSQEMLLPPPAQRTSMLFKCSKSSHYSSWKEKNVTLWGYKLQESFGARRKTQRNKLPSALGAWLLFDAQKKILLRTGSCLKGCISKLKPFPSSVWKHCSVITVPADHGEQAACDTDFTETSSGGKC